MAQCRGLRCRGTGDTATPSEDVALQRLIELTDDAAEAVEATQTSSVRRLTIERAYEGRSEDGPFVRCEATIRLDSIYSEFGSVVEMQDAIKDELCKMFDLRRK